MAKRFTIEAVIKAVDRFSKPVRGIGASISVMSKRSRRSLEAISRSAEKLNSSFTKAGRGIAAAVAGTGFAAKSIISSGMEFEQAIADIGAVSLSTKDEIQDLTDEALRLGATTKFTATQAAQAMEVMARAGFKNEEVLSGIGGILAATAAEGGDIVAVTETVSSIIKGMGLDAKETNRVADVLALASARTKSTITSLGESMKTLGPVARQVGVSLEEAVTMAALLQDVGLDASEAGTATATMFTKLSKPSAQVAKQLNKMGVAFKDASGNMLPPVEVLRQLQNAAEQAGGNMDQLALFADLVGLRGQKAALNLSKLFAEGKGESLVKELNEATGSAEKMAALRMDTLAGDLNLLSAAVDAVKIKIFQTESGPLRDLVQGMKEWVEANGEMIAQDIAAYIQKVIDNIKEIIDTVKIFLGILVGLKTFILIVDVATAAATAFTGVWAVSKGIWALVVGGLAKVTSGFTVLTAVMMANPFVFWGVVATAAIVAIGAILWIFWDDIKMIMHNIGVGFEWLWDKLVAGWNAIGDFISGVWTWISEGFADAVRSIAQGLINLLTGPLRLVIAGLEKVGILDAGTLARVEQAINIQSPQERTASAMAESHASVDGEIRVSASPGTQASVKQGSSNSPGVRLQATGAL